VINSDLTPGEKFASARAIVRKHWPYIMDTVYAITPRPSANTLFKTMQLSPGLVLSYDVAYVNGLSKEELASALVHEVSHFLRDFFGRIAKVDNPQLYGIAADLPINHDLKKSGIWTMRSDWLYPSTFGFPDGKATEEYYEMLKQNQNDPKVKSILAGLKKEIGCGTCGIPGSAGMEVDQEKGEDGQPIGRTPGERKSIVRQTVQAMKQEMETKGRGSLPSFFSELVDLEHKPSRIPWRDRLAYVIRYLSGPIISGGDDFSLRHPSKRSFTRRLLRPGLIDQTLDPLFIVDTSGSMSQKQMMAGISESLAVLQQMGIEEGWLCMVDAAVAMKPKRINFSDLVGEIKFLGRGGTDFGPGLRAAVNMYPRPDLIFYWTDGDGYAPRSPCPIPTVWGVVPHSHFTRRPAKWGTVVTITDDESHPEDDESSFQSPFLPPAGYPGYEEGTVDEEPDSEEYEKDENDFTNLDDDD
jgi:predicted metal-dependent peptidase